MPLFELKWIEVQGLAESTLGDTIREAAKEYEVQVQADKEPDQNRFIRSDQYSFIRNGVPALAFKFGYEFGTPEDKIFHDWVRDRYHKPSDDLNQPVDKASAAKFDRIIVSLLEKVADDGERPHWTIRSSRGSRSNPPRGAKRSVEGGRIMRTLIFCLITVEAVFGQPHDMGKPVEKPVALYKGLGNWRHPIATRSEEAQKYFDQGLALLYGFNRYEALRSFRKVTELDPNSVMGYWGMAMSTGPYINMGTEGDGDLDSKAACAAVAAGLKIAGAPARDRAYLEAAATRCPEYKPEAYVAAMKSLAERYPDDLDAATLYAENLMVPVRWHWYAGDGKAAPGVAEAERGAGAGAAPVAEPSGRESLLHSRGGKFADAGTGDSERADVDGSGAVGGAHRPHAGAHLAGVGRLRNGGERERAGERSGPGVLRGDGRGGRVQHVLRAQSALRGVCAVDAGEACGYGEGGEGSRGSVGSDGGDHAGDGGCVSVGAAVAADAGAGVGRDSEAAAAGGEVRGAVHVVALCADDGIVGQGRSGGSGAGEGWVRSGAEEGARGSSVGQQYLRRCDGDGLGDHGGADRRRRFALGEGGGAAGCAGVRRASGVELSVAGILRRGARARGTCGDAEKVFREGLRRSPRNGWMIFGIMEAMKAQGKTEGLAELQHELDAAWGKADVKLTLGAM